MTTAWIQTHSGKAFHYDAPTPEMVDIHDIAHALSNLCRFGGHPSRFYSVAEHSHMVSWIVPKKYAMQGLLHDATEAFVVDVPRPLKAILLDYQDVEDRVWLTIAHKFGLPVNLHPSVKLADNQALLAERNELLKQPPPHPWTWAAGIEPAKWPVIGLKPEDAKKLFLDRFKELGGKV
jgi:hypothetical protein